MLDTPVEDLTCYRCRSDGVVCQRPPPRHATSMLPACTRCYLSKAVCSLEPPVRVPVVDAADCIARGLRCDACVRREVPCELQRGGISGDRNDICAACCRRGALPSKCKSNPEEVIAMFDNRNDGSGGGSALSHRDPDGTLTSGTGEPKYESLLAPSTESLVPLGSSTRTPSLRSNDVSNRLLRQGERSSVSPSTSSIAGYPIEGPVENRPPRKLHPDALPSYQRHEYDVMTDYSDEEYVPLSM